MPEGTDVNKNNGLCECIIFHYWYLVDISFRFQPKVCNACRDLMQKSMSFNGVATVSLKGNDHIIHFLYMSKDEAINVLESAELRKKMYIIKIQCL